MNVILISLDSLRKDKVGCFNSTLSPSLTPNLDTLAANATRFEQNYTVMGATIPSHASIFTGCYPTTHGIRKNGWKLTENIMMLAEILKKEGYATAGAVGVETLSSIYGFNRGFDHFFDNSKYDRLTYYLSKIGWKRYTLAKAMQHFGIFDTHSRDYQKVNQDVFNWLDKNHHNKFFLFVHYFDLHGDTFGGKRKLKDKAPHYDENVKIVDRALGQLLEKLKTLQVLNDTLIIVLADHGESLSGAKLGHGRELKEEELNVPLIISYPKVLPAKTITTLTRNIDVMPTVLELLKVPTYFKMDGVSLIPTIFNDEILVKDIFVETYPGFNNIKGLRTNDWFYILKENEQEELYKVNAEQQLEPQNLSEQQEIALRMKVRVKKHFDLKYKEQEVDDYTLQMLKKLGYA